MGTFREETKRFEMFEIVTKMSLDCDATIHGVDNGDITFAINVL